MKVYNFVDSIKKYLSSLSSSERAEYMQIVRAHYSSLIMSEFGLDTEENYMGYIKYPYSKLLCEDNIQNNIKSTIQQLLSSLKVFLQVGLLDFYSYSVSSTDNYQYGFISDTNENALKFLYLDLITSGEYVTPLIDAIIRYNGIGVAFNYMFDSRVLSGDEIVKPKIVVDISHSTINEDVMVIKSINMCNMINGMDDMQDAISCLSDRLCIFNPMLGLNYFSDAFFSGKDKIVYGKNKIIPIEFLISSNTQGIFLYNEVIYKQLLVNTNENQYNSYRYLDGLVENTSLSDTLANDLLNIVGYDIGILEDNVIYSTLSDKVYKNI